MDYAVKIPEILSDQSVVFDVHLRTDAVLKGGVDLSETLSLSATSQDHADRLIAALNECICVEVA